MAEAFLYGQSGISTKDATATASDIAVGKTAYTANGKVTGTLVADIEPYELVITAPSTYLPPREGNYKTTWTAPESGNYLVICVGGGGAGGLNQGASMNSTSAGSTSFGSYVSANGGSFGSVGKYTSTTYGVDAAGGAGYAQGGQGTAVYCANSTGGGGGAGGYNPSDRSVGGNGANSGGVSRYASNTIAAGTPSGSGGTAAQSGQGNDGSGYGAGGGGASSGGTSNNAWLSGGGGGGSGYMEMRTVTVNKGDKVSVSVGCGGCFYTVNSDYSSTSNYYYQVKTVGKYGCVHIIRVAAE